MKNKLNQYCDENDIKLSKSSGTPSGNNQMTEVEHLVFKILKEQKLKIDSKDKEIIDLNNKISELQKENIDHINIIEVNNKIMQENNEKYHNIISIKEKLEEEKEKLEEEIIKTNNEMNKKNKKFNEIESKKKKYKLKTKQSIGELKTVRKKNEELIKEIQRLKEKNEKKGHKTMLEQSNQENLRLINKIKNYENENKYLKEEIIKLMKEKNKPNHGSNDLELMKEIHFLKDEINSIQNCCIKLFNEKSELFNEIKKIECDNKILRNSIMK